MTFFKKRNTVKNYLINFPKVHWEQSKHQLRRKNEDLSAMICIYEANLGIIKKNTKNILQMYAIVLPASINVISLVAEESHEKCVTHNTGKALFCTTQQGILMKGMSQHSNPLNGFSPIPEHHE